MENKSGFRLFIEYLAEHKLALAAIVLLIVCVFWAIYKKATAPKRDEQVNLAITVYGYHNEGKEAELNDVLSPNGIKDVNLSYFDISDLEGMSAYLLTYGFTQADVFILDTVVGRSVLNDCFYAFTDEQISDLSSVGFQPKYVLDGESVVGIVIHEKGNDEYNANFSMINEWLLFSAEGEERDFAVFFNADSPHSDKSNFDLLMHILK